MSLEEVSKPPVKSRVYQQGFRPTKLLPDGRSHLGWSLVKTSRSPSANLRGFFNTPCRLDTGSSRLSQKSICVWKKFKSA